MKIIPLTQGKAACVDDDDYAELSKHKWHAHRIRRKHGDNWYAIRTAYNPKRTIQMHTQILGLKGGDHRDRNGLNNQKENLRTCNKSQNQVNSKRTNKSGFRGVQVRRKRFRARIRIHWKDISLGTFNSAAEAAKTYDRAAVKTWGEFATLNFPNE